MAGLRKGSVLFRELIRCGVESEARALILENVEGMVSWLDKSPTSPTFGLRMPQIIENEMIEAGYMPEWRVLNCADYGTPQTRKRIIFVAFASIELYSRWTWPVKSHGPEGERSWISVREALGLDGEFKIGRREGANGFQGERLLNVNKPGVTVGTKANADFISPLDAPSPCVTASEHKAENVGVRGGKAAPRRAVERLAAALERPAPTIKANTYHKGTSDRPSQRPGGELAVALEELEIALSEAGLADRPATTIQAQGSGRVAPAGHHDRQWNGAVRLGPRELATLQGFPPGFVFHGNLTAQYRQIGNAFPAQPAEAIGRSLAMVLGR